jgi:hypothetical protein
MLAEVAEVAVQSCAAVKQVLEPVCWNLPPDQSFLLGGRWASYPWP